MNRQIKYLLMAFLILVIFCMLFQKNNYIEGLTGSKGYAGLLGWPSSKADNIKNITRIKNTIGDYNIDDKIIGGWWMTPYGNQSLWGTDKIVNTLLPGGFQSDAGRLPSGNNKGTDPKVINNENRKLYLTLGGDKVGTVGQCSDSIFIDNVSNWINNNPSCSGICFDTEGCYGGKLADTVKTLNTVIDKIENKINNDKKPLKYILSPLGDLNSNIPSRE